VELGLSLQGVSTAINVEKGMERLRTAVGLSDKEGRNGGIRPQG